MHHTDGNKPKANTWYTVIRSQGLRFSLLKEALYSVAIQDYEPKKVFIIYNPRKDDSEKIKKEKRSKYNEIIEKLSYLLDIEFIEIEENDSPRAMQPHLGLSRVDEGFVSFLDEDDIYYPSMGSFLIDNMKKDNVDVGYGNSIVIFQRRMFEETPYDYQYNLKRIKGYGEKYNQLMILLDNYIPFNTFIVRKRTDSTFTFDKDLRMLEDWDFLITLASTEGVKFKYYDHNVSEYRKHDAQYQSHSVAHEKEWKDARKRVFGKISDRSYKIEGDTINDLRTKVLFPQYVQDPTEPYYTLKDGLGIVKKYFVDKSRSGKKVIEKEGVIPFTKLFISKFTNRIR